MLLLGTALLAAAVWLNDYGHYVGPSKSLRRSGFVGFVQPGWADPAAAAAAILGGALVLVALAGLLRRR